MKKLPLFLVSLSTVALLLTGCDQSQPATAQAKNEVLGRPASDTPPPAPVQTLEEQALSLSLSSPEAAAKLAAKSPESVAIAARSASEKALVGIAASPESSMVQINAYAQLAKAAVKLAPGSAIVTEAAAATEKARVQAAKTLKGNK